jgi:hypothetical protein
VKKVVIALVALAVFAPGALAATHFLKLSSSKVAAGKAVTVSGSVGKGCQIDRKNDSATIYSGAFKGATKHSFAGTPAVSASLAKSKNGAFSVSVKLAKTVKAATYTVNGRCGGGKFGSAKLTVTKASSGSGSGLVGFY